MWTRIVRLQSGLRTPLGRRAVRFRVVPSDVHQGLLWALKPTTVFDVGANRGQFSLDVATALDAVRVIAFEPLAREADIYRRIFANDERFVMHEVALGRSAGTGLINISAARDSSSMLPIGLLQQETFPGTHAVGTESVETRTLDGMLESSRLDSNSLLKLDVQGGELDVLLGAEETLRRIRWVYGELSFVELYEGQALASDLIAHLSARNFDLVHTGQPVVVGGTTVQVDALFEQRSG